MTPLLLALLLADVPPVDPSDLVARYQCNMSDGSTLLEPGEVTGLYWSDKTHLDWTVEPNDAVYDVASWTRPGPAGCALYGSEFTSIAVADPAPGQSWWFVVRAVNNCKVGPWGEDRPQHLACGR